MFRVIHGKKVFKYGHEEHAYAKLASKLCKDYLADPTLEEETPDQTCYNCAFRRWTEFSFHCLKV